MGRLLMTEFDLFWKAHNEAQTLSDLVCNNVDSTAMGESPSLRTKGQQRGMKLAADTRMGKE